MLFYDWYPTMVYDGWTLGAVTYPSQKGSNVK